MILNDIKQHILRNKIYNEDSIFLNFMPEITQNGKACIGIIQGGGYKGKDMLYYYIIDVYVRENNREKGLQKANELFDIFDDTIIVDNDKCGMYSSVDNLPRPLILKNNLTEYYFSLTIKKERV